MAYDSGGISDPLLLGDLQNVKSLIGTPGSWIKLCRARDADGRSVCDDDPSAVSFCLLGAAGRATALHDKNGDRYFRVVNAMLAELGQLTGSPYYNHGAVATFNNASDTKHADLMAFMDRVIARVAAPVSA